MIISQIDETYNYHVSKDFIRVSNQHPCPICEKPDWCGVSADGHIAICMRIEEGSIKETKNGGYLHILKENRPPLNYSPTFTPSKDPPQRASPEVLNRVYQDLHAQLSLSPSDRKHLIEDRRLTPEEVRKLGYKTLPAPDEILERGNIIKPLVEREGRKLLTVPGFYLTDSGRIWLAGTGGLLILCKDVDGNTVGYQIRTDDANNGGKYRWFSTPKRKRKRGGVSSGTPIHVAGTESDSTRVWITEGILKADIAALKFSEIVIGVAGVSSWNADELKKTLEKLYAKEVVIAFDADLKKNRNVKRAQQKLAQFLLSLGYTVHIAEWDMENGKGVDDLLVNGHQPALRRYYPPVDVDKLKTIAGEQRIRRIVIPDAIAAQASQDVDTLRTQMHNRIYQFAQYADGGALLVKGTQGISKSTSSIRIVDDLWRDGQLRPTLATPRHALIDALTPDDWLHIQPRRPQVKEFAELTPQEGHQHIQAAINAAAANGTLLDLNGMLILCPHHRQADAIANRRWNAVKDLCLTDCIIGTTVGIDGCPYHMQRRSNKPLATVHETLFIPRFCDDIFGNQQLSLYGMPRQVCIIDEPDPAKFYETVDITPDDLSRAIVDAWDKDLKTLLDLVRRTAENVAMRLTSDMDKRHLIGQDVMQELIDFAGGAEKLEKLLKDAKAEAPSKHEKVIVGIDAFIDERRRSYEVIIAGETRFVPKALADPIDMESMWMVKGYALKEGFPIISSFEESEDGNIPLNFTADLLWAMNREFQLYQEGTPYNSALMFTTQAGKPIVRLNLRKEIAVPKEVPLILLDAQGNADLLSRLLRRDVETWEAQVTAPDTDITQLVDGSYGITSLWNRKTKQPKSSLKRLLKKVVFPLVKQNPSEVLIVTWKRVADYLRELQAQGELSNQIGIEHYGNIEGSNEHEHRKRVILLGTPQVSPDQLEEMAHALFQTDHEPVSMETEERWEPYAYQDADERGYEVKVRRYKDERVELLARLFKEDEIVQAAHRVRPLLHKGREIYLLTHLPLAELPPTRLVTLDELAATLETNPKPVDGQGRITREFFNDFAKGFLVENGCVWLESLKPVLSQTLVNSTIKDIYGENDQRLSSCGLPSDSTLKRWLKELALKEGWNRSSVTVEHRGPDRGGGATWILAYHEDELDAYQVRADYAEAMGIDLEDAVIVESLPWTTADKVVAIPLSPNEACEKGGKDPPMPCPETSEDVTTIDLEGAATADESDSDADADEETYGIFLKMWRALYSFQPVGIEKLTLVAMAAGLDLRGEGGKAFVLIARLNSIANVPIDGFIIKRAGDQRYSVSRCTQGSSDENSM